MKIYIATHKEYEFPNDVSYQPIQVGREFNKSIPGIIGDNVNDNISNKNKTFCELTALYWIWKNCSDDIVGLVHYRRYFKGRENELKIKEAYIINSNDVLEILNSYDIVLPKKNSFKSGSVFNEYCKNHYMKDMILVKESIMDLCPEYVDSFNHVMNSSSLCMCNMFIGKKIILDGYCAWLFNILFDVESKIDISNYSVYQKRLFGFLSERLFNVWLFHNRNLIKKYYSEVVSLDPIQKPKFTVLERLNVKVHNTYFLLNRMIWKKIYHTL